MGCAAQCSRLWCPAAPLCNADMRYGKGPTDAPRAPRAARFPQWCSGLYDTTPRQGRQGLAVSHHEMLKCSRSVVVASGLLGNPCSLGAQNGPRQSSAGYTDRGNPELSLALATSSCSRDDPYNASFYLIGARVDRALRLDPHPQKKGLN